MQRSPSWEANLLSASQEIPRILWNPKVHYLIHKRLPPVPILSQLDPVFTTHPTSCRSIWILAFHLRLGFPSGLFPSGFSTETLYTPSYIPSSGLGWSYICIKKYILMIILNQMQLYNCTDSGCLEPKIFCYIYRVIRNDCRGFNNLSCTIHLRQEYKYFFI